MALFHTTVVDNQIKALDTIGSASGSIATFDTDRAERLVSCVCEVASSSSEINVSACGKNFLEPTMLSSLTVNGITFTALSDGTIKANGQATANANLMINNITGGGNLFDNLLPLNNMACIGSGCPNVSGCRISFARMNGSSFFDDTGSGVSFTVGNLTLSTNAYVRLQVNSGYTVDNVIFKPMIRLANVTDDTYEQYNGTTYNIQFGETLSDTATYDAISGVLTRNDSTTKQLDSCNIVALDNETNNVYCDTGDIIDLKFVLTVGKAIS